MMHGWTPDTSGVKQTKPTPSLFNTNLLGYQEASNWVKAYLLQHGYVVKEVVLDPYTQRWMFYTAEGEFVTFIEHELMERLLGVLVWGDYAVSKRSPAQVPAR